MKDDDILEEITLTDLSIIALLSQEKKQMILILLIKKAMNILEISNVTKLNPGTIKRNLDQMLEGKLIKIAKIEENSLGVKMKFYRAVAKKYISKNTFP